MWMEYGYYINIKNKFKVMVNLLFDVNNIFFFFIVKKK